jgi:hypothetical protein
VKAPSKEFGLVVACCRWPPGEGRRSHVLSKSEGVDWGVFEAIVRRHRVDALVWNALNEAGVDIAEPTRNRLRDMASQVAAQNLVMAAECFRLQSELEAAGVDLLFLKGLTLGVIAYGTPSLKMASDIDILVPPDAIEQAADVLRRLEHDLLVPDSRLPGGRLARWHGAWKESVWRSPGDLVVELHSALVDNPRLLEGVGIHSPRQEVEISRGKTLPTFADSELFAYLCVHGASSAWFRLKWIADFAAFISRRKPAEITALYDRSQALGAGRSADLALLLASTLLDIRLEPELVAKLRSDRVNRWMVRACLGLMTKGDGISELHQLRFGTFALHAVQYGLRPGWTFKLAEFGQQLVDPYGVAAGHGPARRLAARFAALARAGRRAR